MTSLKLQKLVPITKTKTLLQLQKLVPAKYEISLIRRFKNNNVLSVITLTFHSYTKSKRFYSAFTETGATQTMVTNQMAELKQEIPTFSNPANRMSSTKQ